MWKRGHEFKCNVWQGLSANGEAFVQVAEELLTTDKYDCEIQEFVNGTRGTPQELLQEKTFKDLLTPKKVEEPAGAKIDKDSEIPGYNVDSEDELPKTNREGQGTISCAWLLPRWLYNDEFWNANCFGQTNVGSQETIEGQIMQKQYNDCC